MFRYGKKTGLLNLWKHIRREKSGKWD